MKKEMKIHYKNCIFEGTETNYGKGEFVCVYSISEGFLRGLVINEVDENDNLKVFFLVLLTKWYIIYFLNMFSSTKSSYISYLKLYGDNNAAFFDNIIDKLKKVFILVWCISRLYISIFTTYA